MGLTRYETESAFSLSLVREGRLMAETMWQQKAQMLKKSGLLSLYRGGLSALKAISKRALLQLNRDNLLDTPRGVLLLSPPGCGKSAFCKALGKDVGRPVLMLDVGSLMGSLVGQFEERTRQALKHRAKRRTWKKKRPRVMRAYHRNRRNTTGVRGRRLQRLRSEKVERTFAHLCDTGVARRTWLRGLERVQKRYKTVAMAYNLGRIMRRLLGAGKPRHNALFAGLLRFIYFPLERLRMLIAYVTNREALKLEWISLLPALADSRESTSCLGGRPPRNNSGTFDSGG